MCGGLKVHRILVRPGQSLKYRTLAGEKTAVWGTGFYSYDDDYHNPRSNVSIEDHIYNARSENLLTHWPVHPGSRYSRVIVEVDSFEEKGVDFRWGSVGPTALAAVHDSIWDCLIILTESARDGIEEFHSRQPVVLREPQSWLEEGTISIRRVSGFQRLMPSAEERRRTFLAESIK